MATPMDSNLYPPVIATYMPAFIRTKNCVVKFSLSSYNTFEDISKAEISLRFQSTNQTALVAAPGKPLKDNNLIEYNKSELHAVVTEDGEEFFTLTIDTKNIKGGEFAADTLYKLQIRFKNKNDVTSEWSTVCLLLGIDEPEVYFKQLDFEVDTSKDNFIMEIPQTLDLIGQMTFKDSEVGNRKLEKEYLSQWSAVIRKYDNDEVVFKTGIIFTNTFENPNNINYTVPYDLPLGLSYYIVFTFVTNNGYEFKKEYKFKMVESSIEELDAIIEVESDVQNGSLNILIYPNTNYKGNITIRRSSSKTNFLVWEDIYTNNIELRSGKKKPWAKNDITVESGVWYRYQIQKRNIRGDRGRVILTDKKMIVLEYSYLFDGKTQLCLKYNTNISSLSYTVAENKSDTIGSQYPYIRKNANIMYRQFPLSGTICRFSNVIEDADINKILNKDSVLHEGKPFEVEDDINTFYDRKAVLGNDVVNLYDEYNIEHNVQELYDTIWEKEFRDEVTKFLHKHRPLLFRSATEGNILVKLMDISFTPKAEIDRMIYDFSANAVEVGENTLEKLSALGLYDAGTFSTSSIRNYDRIGQYKTKNGIAEDVVESIKNKINIQETSEIQYNFDRLQAIRISFQDKPYLIAEGPNNTLVRVGQDGSGSLVGYIAKINGQDTFINRNGVFQFTSKHSSIDSVILQDAALVDYIAAVEEVENVLIPVATYSMDKLGQLRDTFSYGEDIVQDIKNRHLIAHKDYEQSVDRVFALRIEAPQGALFSIKSRQGSYRDFIISDTEELVLNNRTIEIESCLARGMKLERTDNPIVSPGHFYLNEKDSPIYEMLARPQQGHVFVVNKDDITQQAMDTSAYLRAIIEDDCLTIEIDEENVYINSEDNYSLILRIGQAYIYYDDKFLLFELGDNFGYIEGPIGARIDYGCELRGKEYAK